MDAGALPSIHARNSAKSLPRCRSDGALLVLGMAPCVEAVSQAPFMGAHRHPTARREAELRALPCRFTLSTLRLLGFEPDLGGKTIRDRTVPQPHALRRTIEGDDVGRSVPVVVRRDDVLHRGVKTDGRLLDTRPIEPLGRKGDPHRTRFDGPEIRREVQIVIAEEVVIGTGERRVEGHHAFRRPGPGIDHPDRCDVIVHHDEVERAVDVEVSGRHPRIVRGDGHPRDR